MKTNEALCIALCQNFLNFIGFNGERLKCCGVAYSDFHPECFPIRLPDNDPINAPAHQLCQDYARSATAPRTGCTLGNRKSVFYYL